MKLAYVCLMEVPMMTLPRIVGATSCGFLLCLGLSGPPAWAADEMKADQSVGRIGGQAGVEGEKGKLEGLDEKSSSGERIGGQAGQVGEKGKLEGLSGKSSRGRRIGGQAGLEGEEGKLEGLSDKSSVGKKKGRASSGKGKGQP